jgi:hypothetical protein
VKENGKFVEEAFDQNARHCVPVFYETQLEGDNLCAGCADERNLQEADVLQNWNYEMLRSCDECGKVLVALNPPDL